MTSPRYRYERRKGGKEKDEGEKRKISYHQ
jgi:hypothetical protein